ncbi:MAG: DUF309 domain-containing protein [bacterium]
MCYLPANSPEYFTSSPFCEAVHSFNARNWYHAHDQFEELWHNASGEIRELLQGIIQISVAEYHLENGNTRGSTLLMAEGLNHLESFTSLGVGYDLVLLHDLVRKRLSALQNQTDPSSLPKPYLKSV